jgi:hypothetical protein
MYKPLLIDLNWGLQIVEECKDKPYHLLIAKNEHAKPYYSSGYHGISWQEVINHISEYVTPVKAEQTSLDI